MDLTGENWFLFVCHVETASYMTNGKMETVKVLVLQYQTSAQQ